jgi:hypothetical protein
MIIQIRKIPDLPLFDDASKTAKKELKKLKGLRMQALPLGRSYEFTMSRGVPTCKKAYYVPLNNLFQSIIEREPLCKSFISYLFNNQCDRDGVGANRNQIYFVFTNKEAKEI